MKRFLKAMLFCVMLSEVNSVPVFADYTKGTTMFQIYGGGAGLAGHYHQPGVDRDEQDYADGGGLIGGQFLYFFRENPCLAAGFDISRASFDDHNSSLMLANRATRSSAENTSGLFILRVSYPKGHFRPYIQGGLGAHRTSLSLDGTPINGTTWSDTGTRESRSLLDDGHLGLAFEGAVGMHIYFTERFFIGAEFKILSLGGQDFNPSAAGIQEGLLNPSGHMAETGLGLMLGFGF